MGQGPYTALDIAKWFVNAADRQSGDAVTHLKVQKLVYYAQGWSLAIFGEPLFNEDLQAWSHGPVARSIWNEFKDSSWNALPELKTTRKIVAPHSSLLESVQQQYGIYSAKRLESMTHKEPPWREARGNLPPEARCENTIPKKAMKNFFEKVAKGQWAY
jgi:uncharacterized phage-associated protein